MTSRRLAYRNSPRIAQDGKAGRGQRAATPHTIRLRPRIPPGATGTVEPCRPEVTCFRVWLVRNAGGQLRELAHFISSGP